VTARETILLLQGEIGIFLYFIAAFEIKGLFIFFLVSFDFLLRRHENSDINQKHHFAKTVSNFRDFTDLPKVSNHVCIVHISEF
jgi:hypothetical protein